MSVREFTTAAKAADRRDDAELPEPVTFTIDGRDVIFNPPTPGQLAMAVAVTGMTDVQATADIINFFINLLGPNDQRFFRSRLFSPDDDFGPEEITAIVQGLIEEWSARPTKQPSDYLPSQSSDGRRSTRPVRRSTR